MAAAGCDASWWIVPRDGDERYARQKMIRVRDGDSDTVLSMDEFERRARRGEISPHALVCLPALTGEAFVEARSLSVFAAVYDPRRLLFRRHFSVTRLPLVTATLAALCIGLWLVARDMGDGVVTREALLLLGAKARARIVDEGETWRLLVASCLHKDGVHLGFNLFVLVAVGSVLEGVYRRGDYALLLVLSGLACMVTSTIASPPATVGASGMVFGCLGCAVVFGLRFADVLPGRYRLTFGAVLVGYTAVAFWLGLVRSSTDNWGHGGGLICGLVMGMLLEPRLLRLREHRERRLLALRPWVILAVIVVATVGVGPLLQRAFRGFEPMRFGAFGVVIEHPRTWTRAPDPLGFLAVGNGTDALMSLACTRGRRPEVDVVARKFVDGELFGLLRAGHIANLEVDPIANTTLDGGSQQARRVSFSFVASDGPFVADAAIFVRGEIECALVAAHRRDASEGAVALLEEMVRRLRLVPTDAEVQALEQTRASPDSTRDWLALALAHQGSGDVVGARKAFGHTLELVPTEPGWTGRVHAARAAFELHFGGDFDAASQSAQAALRADEQADTRALVVAAAKARKEIELACIETLAARARYPTDARFAATRACP